VNDRNQSLIPGNIRVPIIDDYAEQYASSNHEIMKAL